MGRVHHGSARTTAAVRRAIQHRQESLRHLARHYGIHPKTVAKRRKRASVADLPTGPKEPKSSVLSADEEAIVVAFRRHTLLPLDDCLYALGARGTIGVEKLEERVAGLEDAQREAKAALERARAEVPVVELHPGAIEAYRRNIGIVARRISTAASLADGPLERAVIDAFRAMISRVVVTNRDDGKYGVDVIGPLSGLTGAALPDRVERW